MTPCPRDHTPLTDIGAGIHRCPTCHHDYVISVTDAWTSCWRCWKRRGGRR